ncbi:MAG TPA: LamG-like jellyroll fold domain-containing protein [Thermoanaerobaculia bacterium]|nr:LamG-like jellyroll fold domain-containing protein [Thermoanaerobaculia bacterium]
MKRISVVAFLLVCSTSAVFPVTAATLVADYRFEDPNDLGVDSSGLGNQMSVVGGVTQGAGRNVTTMAAFFDGSTGKLERLSGLSGYDGQPGLTFSAWVYIDPSSDGYDGVVVQDTGGCCIHRLLLDPSHQPFVNLGAHDDRSYPAPQPTGTWFHLVLVGEDVGGNREGRVYVNGSEVAGSPQTFTGDLLDSSALNTYLGTGEGGGSYPLLGGLDDVQIYDGALTATEVLQLYQAQVGTADLSVTKTAEPTEVSAGEEVTYTITVSNAGPLAATGVMMEDALPEGMSLVSATASQGDCAEVAGTVSCDLGTIASGSDAKVTLVVQTRAIGSFENSVTVSGEEFDPDGAAATAPLVTALSTDVPALDPKALALLALVLAFAGMALLRR